MYYIYTHMHVYVYIYIHGYMLWVCIYKYIHINRCVPSSIHNAVNKIYIVNIC